MLFASPLASIMLPIGKLFAAANNGIKGYEAVCQRVAALLPVLVTLWKCVSRDPTRLLAGCMLETIDALLTVIARLNEINERFGNDRSFVKRAFATGDIERAQSQLHLQSLHLQRLALQAAALSRWAGPESFPAPITTTDASVYPQCLAGATGGSFPLLHQSTTGVCSPLHWMLTFQRNSQAQQVITAWARGRSVVRDSIQLKDSLELEAANQLHDEVCPRL